MVSFLSFSLMVIVFITRKRENVFLSPFPFSPFLTSHKLGKDTRPVRQGVRVGRNGRRKEWRKGRGGGNGYLAVRREAAVAFNKRSQYHNPSAWYSVQQKGNLHLHNIHCSEDCGGSEKGRVGVTLKLNTERVSKRANICDRSDDIACSREVACACAWVRGCTGA